MPAHTGRRGTIDIALAEIFIFVKADLSAKIGKFCTMRKFPAIQYLEVLLYTEIPCVKNILTALSHCTSNCEITVLPIHVVSAAARVVSQPDTDIFDLGGRFVTHLEGVRR